MRQSADHQTALQLLIMSECEGDQLLDCARLAASAKTFHARYSAFIRVQTLKEAAFERGEDKR